jgi:hypothetical protein
MERHIGTFVTSLAPDRLHVPRDRGQLIDARGAIPVDCSSVSVGIVWTRADKRDDGPDVRSLRDA